jgi:hypothetical protein
VFYGSNPYRKDNPRRVISNATDITKVPEFGAPLPMPAPAPRNRQRGDLTGSIGAAGDGVRLACGIAGAWLMGLPRRAGRRMHAMNDTEARQWGWLVIERRGGLVHQYRDARFEALRHDPTLRRDELRHDEFRAGGTQPPSADCPGGGDA